MDEIKQPTPNEPISVVHKESSGGKAILWILVILVVGALLFVLFAKGDDVEDFSDTINTPAPTTQTPQPQAQEDDGVSEAEQIQAELEATAIDGMSDSL
jgi:hypothetical protein